MAAQETQPAEAKTAQPVVLSTPVLDAIRERGAAGIKPALKTIPNALRKIPLWGFLRTMQVPGEAKVRKSNHPRQYKSNDDSGGTAVEALSYFARCAAAGTHDNLVLSWKLRLGSDPGRTWVAYDFDHCIDPETGKIIDSHVAALVELFQDEVWFEVSPSGTGLHAIGWLPAPPAWNGVGPYKRANVERYCDKRLFSVTGQRISKWRSDLRLPEDFDTVFTEMFVMDAAPESSRSEARRVTADPQGAFARADARGFKPTRRQAAGVIEDMFTEPSPVPEDLEPALFEFLIEDSDDAQRWQDFKAGKFIRSDGAVIWTEPAASWPKGREPHGNTVDTSTVDMQAAAHLARWADDPDQIERGMRWLGLAREKWGRDFSGSRWVERIIEGALDQCTLRADPWKQPAFLYRVALHTIERAKDVGTPDAVIDAVQVWFDLQRLDANLFAKARVSVKSDGIMPLGELDKLLKATQRAESEAERARCRTESTARRKALAEPDAVTKSGRIPIDLSRDQADVLRDFKEAVLRINVSKTKFVRMTDSPMARIYVNENSQLVLDELNVNSMRYELVERLECSTWKQDPDRGWVQVRASVPPDYVAMLLEAGDLHLPCVELIAEVPVLDLDKGTVIASGFDAKTGTFVHVPENFLSSYSEHLIEEPTREDARHELAFLESELFEGFPFETDADRANMLGAGLTTVLSFNWGDENVPLMIVMAPTPGSGKTLLATLLSLPMSNLPEIVVVGQKSTEGEFDKAVVAALRSGACMVIIDNVSGEIDSDIMAGLATSGRYTNARLLGQSKLLRIRANRATICTGNNISLSIDLARRYAPIFLDPKTDQPELRTDFARSEDELKAWARANRARILAAWHSIIRAWIRAGKPVQGAPVLGSFHYWANTIGGILSWLGVDGLMQNQSRLMDGAPRKSKLLQVILTIHQRFGSAEFVLRDLHQGEQATVADDLSDFFDLRAQQGRNQLGYFLRGAKATRVSHLGRTYWIESCGMNRLGSQQWRVRSESIESDAT